MVNEDMDRALAIAMQEQQSDVISVDTIRVFNSHLQMEALRGRAVLTVDTKNGFSPRPQVSTATIFSLSDQRPSMMLWSMVLLWGQMLNSYESCSMCCFASFKKLAMISRITIPTGKAAMMDTV